MFIILSKEEKRKQIKMLTKDNWGVNKKVNKVISLIHTKTAFLNL